MAGTRKAKPQTLKQAAAAQIADMDASDIAVAIVVLDKNRTPHVYNLGLSLGAGVCLLRDATTKLLAQFMDVNGAADPMAVVSK